MDAPLDTIQIVDEDLLISVTYVDPHAKLASGVGLQLPLDHFCRTKKHLKITYRRTEVEPGANSWHFELYKIGLLNLTTHNPKFGTNVSASVKNENLSIKAKIILQKSYKGKVCSKIVEKSIVKQISTIIGQQCNQLSLLVKRMCNKELLKMVLEKMDNHSGYVKGVVITEALRLK